MKLFIYPLLILSFLKINAQTEKNYIIKTNLGYKYNHDDKLDLSTNPSSFDYGKKTNDLKSSLTVGRKLNNKFYYGVGLSYNLIKTELNPESDVPASSFNPASAVITMVSYYNEINSNHIISPLIYFQYFMNLNERFSLTIDLVTKYDFSVTKGENTLYLPDIYTYSYYAGATYSSEVKKQFFNIGIFPSLRVNIYKNFGMDLTIGYANYKIKTNDSRLDLNKKSKEFDIDFKPENWNIGFYLEI